ncbi:MAG: hypothetical protein RLZZ543_1618 [Bacteroidota bacterium]|jgi:hypothetical protein
MKKVIINCFLVLLAVSANAQLKYGAKAGLNYNVITYNYEGDVEAENASGIGFHLGGYLVKSFTDKIAFRPELIISRCNVKESSEETYTIPYFDYTATTTTTSEGKENYTYLDIPLLLDFGLSEKLSFQVGPQIGIRAGYKSSGSYSSRTTYSDGDTPTTFEESYSSTSTTGMNSTNFGLALGAIYDTGNGLNFGARYQRGLNSIYTETSFGTANWNVLQFSVGYTLSK